MKTTRMRLTDYLEQRHSATAEELGRALSVTSANVRHHLKVLLAEGVVEVIGQRPAEGRGRPIFIYGLSRQAKTHNLNRLTCAALALLLNKDDKEAQQAVLGQVAEHLAETSSPTSTSPGRTNPSQKFMHAVQHLNQMHYQARWEAHTQGPRVIFSHCPYKAILNERPELCRMDALLLEKLLGQPVQQVARLELTVQGTPRCVFRVIPS